MMMRLKGIGGAVFGLLAGLLVCLPAHGGVIELKDGSRISGEVVALSNGVYTIRSAALGTISVPKSKVRVIEFSDALSSTRSAASPRSQLSTLQPQMEQIQQQLMSSPDLMKSVMKLQSDPQIQRLLSDPQLMRALQSGDLEQLRNNPKLRALMNNPQIKSITRQLQ